MPTPSTTSLFLALPAELRNRIYEFALPKNGKLHVNPRDTKYIVARRPIGLLRVNEQVRQEAIPVFVSNNKFMYHVDPFGKDTVLTLCSWLRFMILTNGTHLGGMIKIKVAGHQVWERLDALLPLMNLMRETGLELATNEDVRRYGEAMTSGSVVALKAAAHASVFEMSSHHAQIVTQEMLEKAVKMARRAGTEGWSSKGLEKKYLSFVRGQISHGSA